MLAQRRPTPQCGRRRTEPQIADREGEGLIHVHADSPDVCVCVPTHPTIHHTLPILPRGALTNGASQTFRLSPKSQQTSSDTSPPVSTETSSEGLPTMGGMDFASAAALLSQSTSIGQVKESRPTVTVTQKLYFWQVPVDTSQIRISMCTDRSAK